MSMTFSPFLPAAAPVEWAVKFDSARAICLRTEMSPFRLVDWTNLRVARFCHSQAPTDGNSSPGGGCDAESSLLPVFSPPHWTKFVLTFAYGSLHSVPSILANASREGLHQGTLYDVVGANGGMGNVIVNATGFNITCGTLPDAHRIPLEYQSRVDQDRTVALDSTEKFIAVIPSTGPNIISSINPHELGNSYGYPFPTSFLMYTIIPILDSKGNFGPLLNFNPPVQTFHWIQSLVPQTAVLDVQSRNLLQINPSILKTSSTWIPSSSLKPTPTGNEFIDAVLENLDVGEYRQFLSAADLQKFNLAAADESKRPSNVTLHDLENGLSEIVAAMFWTLGHVVPTYDSVIEATANYLLLRAALEPPILLQGNVMVTEITAQTGCNLNIVAVAVGLAASICLALICLRHSIFPKTSTNDENLAVDGTGILHIIWLYRNHPQLNRVLEQVHHPSDENLRKAGMVKTSFGGSPRKPNDMGSFDWTQHTVDDPTENISDLALARDLLAPEVRVPKRSILQSVQILRLISLLLHFILTGMHSLLVFMDTVYPRRGSQRSIHHNLLCAAGIHNADASMRRDLRIHQPLTTVHDHAAAWLGLGSAFLCLWRQMAVPASISGVRSAFFFLGNIALLSRIVAGMFWTLGHLPPFHGPVIEGADQVVLNPPLNPPILLKGNVPVNTMVVEAHLEMNTLAILVGLATSIALAGLSLRYSLFHKIPQGTEDIAIDGTGILHTIWLYRNHPELPTLLEQIELPTETNLRRAGMVDLRLSG
ncbi:hypothetical protein C8R45DRAFT_1160467 [Mycena sanguinolenta]|nr:hypothetical protein C8R45DRAFT_1160467 [Mycena sanguinolenta]